MARYRDVGRIEKSTTRGPARRLLLAAALGAGLVGGGCANNTQTGMLVGGAGGAGAGAAIGSAGGHAGTGALIGGTIGLIGGGLVGNSIDQQKEEERRAEERRRYDARASGSYLPGGYAAPRPEPVSQDEVVAWSRKGTSDEVIIDRIERSDTVFHLTAADEASLRDQGVSADVVRSMENTGRK